MVVWVAALGAVGLLLILASKSSSSHVQKLLEKTRTFLPGASIDPTTGEAWGKLRGLHVTYWLTMRGAGSSAEAWTEVEVHVDTRGIRLELRRQTRYEEDLRDRGLSVDLVLGDEAFDRAFIVEAAPADVVKELLDDGVRARRTKVKPDEVIFSGAKAQLARKGWYEEAGPMAQLVQAVMALAERIPVAIEAANRRLALVAETAYRGVDASSRQAAREQLEQSRKAEVEHVLHVKERREKHLRAGGILLLTLLLGFVALVLAAQACD